jgi:hypothetical protein
MRSTRSLVLGLLALGLTAVPSRAQTLQEAVISNLETVRDKMVAMAEAVPADEYGTKVHPDVRSFGDELMHVASSNYRWPGMIGVEAPADVPEAWRRGTVESPEETAKALNASFDFLFDAIRGIDDLNATATVMRREMSMNAYLLTMTTHLQEHLGKAITDCRAAGVVPPWSS